MIDAAASCECVEEWLPDFIAYAERPTHPLASDLLARARKRIWDSYAANTTYDDPALSYDHAEDQIDYAADDVATILQATAEWIVANREPSNTGSKR